MVTDVTGEDDQGPQRSKSTVNNHPSKVIFKSPFRSTTSSSQVSFSSNISLVYACLVWLLLTELVLSYCLYTYTAHVDRKCTSAVATATQQAAAAMAAAAQTNPFHDFELYRRRKRRARASPSSVLEDNTVNPSGVAGAEGANVEFFNPKLRQELEEKDMHGSGKKAAPGSTQTEGETANNPWVWLTSYSRIPVSSRLHTKISMAAERGIHLWCPQNDASARRGQTQPLDVADILPENASE
ncbi:hypothetical protein B7P43_G02587 [Cryptotermes secundus]|uniref:Uncharacterized protein n=1 Tax=Cryptotermes secundus TaxID=105785 RepID=A0A2J7R3D5_9NEOP|nr:hypothetical protein B7P43_G02587 [Cryptotermes secundus]